MKTTITIFCTLLLGCLMLNAQNSNNLIVFSENGERFYLVLNGLKYNQSPETNVKVTGLNATNYKAKVIFEKPVGDLNANVYLIWEGNPVNNQEFTYAIKKKGDKYHLKMISHADIGPQTSNTGSAVYNSNTGVPETQTTATSQSVSTNTNTGNSGYNSSTTVTTTTANSTPQNGSVSINMNTDGMNMNINMNGISPSNSGSSTTVTSTSYTTSTTSYNSSSSVNSNNNTTGATSGTTTNGGCTFAMNDGSFNDLQNSIKAKSFEDAKLKIAKQGVSVNCVSAAQVRKLMDLFSFEENKLELTKFAYAYTTDKSNYFKVNDGFAFESSVDELNDFISKNK